MRANATDAWKPEPLTLVRAAEDTVGAPADAAPRVR
jgi:hypothetical protein